MQSARNDDWPEEFRNPKSPWFWWWRESKAKILAVPWGKKKPITRDQELGAFRFELARRFDRSIKKRGQPYPLADRQTRDLLAPFTTPPSPILIGGKKPPRRVQYVELPSIAFCVRAARGQILNKMALLLDKKCQEQGIELPDGPEGRQNRPPSWRWLELLDRKDILGHIITDENDRVKISPARKAAARFKKELVQLTLLNEEPAEPPEE